MNETKNKTTKTLFIVVIVVAVIAGIYVSKMNEVDNHLGIGATATTAPAAKGVTDGNLVPGGSQIPPAPAATETPAVAPASPDGPNPPSPVPTQASPAANAPVPAQTAPATPQTLPANKKTPGKKTAG